MKSAVACQAKGEIQTGTAPCSAPKTTPSSFATTVPAHKQLTYNEKRNPKQLGCGSILSFHYITSLFIRVPIVGDNWRVIPACHAVLHLAETGGIAPIADIGKQFVL